MKYPIEAHYSSAPANFEVSSQSQDYQTRCFNIMVLISKKLNVDLDSVISEFEIMVAPTELEMKLEAERQVLLKRRKHATIEQMALKKKEGVHSLKKEVEQVESDVAAIKAQVAIENLAKMRETRKSGETARQQMRKELTEKIQAMKNKRSEEEDELVKYHVPPKDEDELVKYRKLKKKIIYNFDNKGGPEWMKK